MKAWNFVKKIKYLNNDYKFSKKENKNKCSFHYYKNKF